MDIEIARWRLRNQYLTSPHAGSAAAVVHHLLAVQAENPGQSAWAVGTRTRAADPTDLAGLLASGEVLRTHVLRPTWHYVGRDDLDWLLALTGPRVRRGPVAALRDQHGLGASEQEQLTVAVTEFLTHEPDRTRTEVADHVRERFPAMAERLTSHVMMLVMADAELDRWVCSGTPREGEHTYADFVTRVGLRTPPDQFDRDEALGRLALRYYTGHGPATVDDLAYWATLTLTDARRAVQAVRDRLESFEYDGRPWFHATGSPPDHDQQLAAHLLQVLDEMYRGYHLNTRWVLDAAGQVPRGREQAIGMALLDGQLVAGMKRQLTATTARFTLLPHRKLSRHEVVALTAAADRYGAFLGLPAELMIT
ncbi:winged helix DNA-binding domain-containing protein [Propionibacteriaceae bacterium Y2011]|uniref:winged helix DNA-binding domain-containing protein n=1 Tax=Microlunatus sp. Y2014 TaxID=3418488 RepID=UPI003B4D95E6